MEPAPRSLREMKTAFKALADVSRLRIVLALAEGAETGVTELTETLKSSQPLVSWHLRALRRAGVVTLRRSGRVSLYSLNRQRLQWCQEQLGLLAVGQGAAAGENNTALWAADNPLSG